MTTIGAVADRLLLISIRSVRMTDYGWEAVIQEERTVRPLLGRLPTGGFWMLGGEKRIFGYRSNCGHSLQPELMTALRPNVVIPNADALS